MDFTPGRDIRLRKGLMRTKIELTWAGCMPLNRLALGAGEEWQCHSSDENSTRPALQRLLGKIKALYLRLQAPCAGMQAIKGACGSSCHPLACWQQVAQQSLNGCHGSTLHTAMVKGHVNKWLIASACHTCHDKEYVLGCLFGGLQASLARNSAGPAQSNDVCVQRPDLVTHNRTP